MPKFTRTTFVILLTPSSDLDSRLEQLKGKIPVTLVTNVLQSTTMSTEAYTAPPGIRYIQYERAKESEYVPKIRQLISKDLSEPYSIYVYRYFLYQWGDLCFMVRLIRTYQHK